MDRDGGAIVAAPDAGKAAGGDARSVPPPEDDD